MKQLAGSYDNGATVDNEDAILASFKTVARLFIIRQNMKRILRMAKANARQWIGSILQSSTRGR